MLGSLYPKGSEKPGVFDVGNTKNVPIKIGNPPVWEHKTKIRNIQNIQSRVTMNARDRVCGYFLCV